MHDRIEERLTVAQRAVVTARGQLERGSDQAAPFLGVDDFEVAEATTGLARPQEHPTHRSVHRAGTGSVQGLLALIDRRSRHRS
jgi:hypothetical protein